MKKNTEENVKISTYFIAAASALVSLLAIGTISYHFLEKWTWIDALYFTVATLTTVGYGDLHPTSEMSRLFTIFFILVGVSISIAAITIIGGRYLSRREENIIRIRERRSERNMRK